MATGCLKCNGTGLIPLKRKDGSVVPHAWVYCECYEEELEYYRPLSPEDIDFPVSYSVYRSLCREHGWQDPGSDIPLEDEKQKGPYIPRPIVNVTYKVNDVATPAFKDLEDKIYLLDGRLTKYFEGKKKPKPAKPGELGIKIDD